MGVHSADSLPRREVAVIAVVGAHRQVAAAFTVAVAAAVQPTVAAAVVTDRDRVTANKANQIPSGSFLFARNVCQSQHPGGYTL